MDMDDSTKSMTCNCSPMCENCTNGDHANCTSDPKCDWSDKTTINSTDAPK